MSRVQDTATQAPPRYRSSRSPGGEGVTFREALLAGLAPDGGLYLPERVPALPARWRQAESLPALAAAVLEPWLEEPDGQTLAGLLEGALDFPAPLRPLARDRWLLELFHGPTLSFKDFGARTMARLMDHYLQGSGRRLTVLVATSGDTGSAVADGFADLAHVRVVLLYPAGGVSDVQERQLTAQRPGLTTLAVRGSFDDCQRLVKAAFGDPLLAHLELSSANSINVGRLLPQMTYYHWALLQLQAEQEPLVVVPSGNLGNLTAGLLAARAGAPVAHFVAAHNANDYFPRYLGGSGAPFEFPDTRRTLSNAMDVGAPSNFERLHGLFGEDLSALVSGYSVSDEATAARMRRVHDEDGLIVDPHTAVGLEAVERHRERTGDGRPAIVLSTAHPAKFPATVQSTLRADAPRHPRLEALVDARHAATAIEPSEAALREQLLALA